MDCYSTLTYFLALVVAVTFDSLLIGEQLKVTIIFPPSYLQLEQWSTPLLCEIIFKESNFEKLQPIIYQCIANSANTTATAECEKLTMESVDLLDILFE